MVDLAYLRFDFSLGLNSYDLYRLKEVKGSGLLDLDDPQAWIFHGEPQLFGLGCIGLILMLLFVMSFGSNFFENLKLNRGLG